MSSKQYSDDNARARWFAAWLLKSTADENAVPALLCFFKGKNLTVRNGRANLDECCFAEDCVLLVASLRQAFVCVQPNTSCTMVCSLVTEGKL